MRQIVINGFKGQFSFHPTISSQLYLHRSIYKKYMFGHFIPWFVAYSLRNVQETHINYFECKCKFKPTINSWLFVLDGWFYKSLYLMVDL